VDISQRPERKKCVVCDQTVDNDLLQCPKCGSGVFKTEVPKKSLVTNVDNFLSELEDIYDVPDVADISSRAEVREANIMAANPERRAEGLSRLSHLVNRFPTSGNICALYTQALAWDGREREALRFANQQFPKVNMKSDLACAAGIVSLHHSNLYSAALWFLRAAAAQRGKPPDEHLMLELSCIYRAVGATQKNEQILAVYSKLQSFITGRVQRSTEDDLTGMARDSSDETLAAILSAAADQLGWTDKTDTLNQPLDHLVATASFDPKTGLFIPIKADKTTTVKTDEAPPVGRKGKRWRFWK